MVPERAGHAERQVRGPLTGGQKVAPLAREFTSSSTSPLVSPFPYFHLPTPPTPLLPFPTFPIFLSLLPPVFPALLSSPLNSPAPNSFSPPIKPPITPHPSLSPSSTPPPPPFPMFPPSPSIPIFSSYPSFCLHFLFPPIVYVITHPRLTPYAFPLPSSDHSRLMCSLPLLFPLFPLLRLVLLHLLRYSSPSVCSLTLWRGARWRTSTGS